MDTFIACLFILPAFLSVLLLVIPTSISRILIIASSIVLSGIALYLFISINEPYRFGVPHFMNGVVAGADLLLLLYFGWVALTKKSWLVGMMTLLQLGALYYLLTIVPAGQEMQFMVDKLSVFMFLLINVISSLIAIFSIQYIDSEKCSSFRKKYFLSIIYWFIAVMNLIVAADSMEYFFLFFELTTLASYLLIGFRKDEIGIKNALTALWMNQIGGLAILAAMFFIIYNGYGEATFTNLLAHSSAAGILLPLALFSVAALIKGAQMPFSKWLLGAMVAPTPVSALLHSSTMVKIAPFIIIRLSPALKNTPVATVMIALTAFVFLASAIGALSQDNIKRILAHSTIALLALMIMMGAVGTPATLVASLILILFHGISKCILFLNAGVLEKVFHFKNASDLDRLGETGAFTSLVILIGFMSLLLPPFGAFMGKWFSIEALGTFAKNQAFLGALVIASIAIGGALLALLYFKVLGVLIAKSGSRDVIKFEKTKPLYSVSIYILLGLLLLSVVGFPFLMPYFFVRIAEQTLHLPIAVTMEGWNLQMGTMNLPIIPFLVAILLLPVTILVARLVKFKNVDRVKEYTCGEKIDYSFSSFYFSTDKATPYFSIIGVLFFIALIAVAVF